MADLKARLNNAKAKFLRRPSAIPASSGESMGSSAKPKSRSEMSLLPPNLDGGAVINGELVVAESLQTGECRYPGTSTTEGLKLSDLPSKPDTDNNDAQRQNLEEEVSFESKTKAIPQVTLQEPTPVQLGVAAPNPVEEVNGDHQGAPLKLQPQREGVLRRQSLVPTTETTLVRTLLESERRLINQGNEQDYFYSGPPTLSANMVHRKLWVKRPGASPTLVTINEDDLVDDVRDMILRKYANSLGRNFDSPDVTLRICPRETKQRARESEWRTLGPEEPICRTLDTFFPGGQTVEEALLIDVPQRRTPRPSPRGGGVHHAPYHADEVRPSEAETDYFPPMPVIPALPQGISVAHHPHSISILNTGQAPPLPSPGTRGTRHQIHPRPKYGRTNTSSPTLITSVPAASNGMNHHPHRPRSRVNSNASDSQQAAPIPPPLPTPPAPEPSQKAVMPPLPPPRVTSPKPKPGRKTKKNDAQPQLPAGLLDGAVPPINVLIVEDNIINLKLLEAFMKRLKVRWQTAMNGREAVTKWRSGGFHLVLMDIQLPIMSGLEATKEIRRLERLNSIGVFSSSASSKAPEDAPEPEGDDKLINTILFKSPVIIVALTASSLQSDRHEALAAGCNDFLTKPVNFVWLERKVMEWGCMQALIDFDGWRKWKDFSQNSDKSTINTTNKASAGNKLAVKREKTRQVSGTGSGSGSSAGVEALEGGKAIAAGA
ncbi:MAG: ssk1 response regulator receiver [Candelina submexicana]|nr:MAG: ssk1 response regulator receiver [Candelina submexicana]